MILHDAYALHRKWWESDWKPGIGDEAWTDWDYILADVYQTIQDYTDTESGQYIPYDQSGEVRWNVRSMFSGAKAAVELEQTRRKELRPGEKLYAVPEFDNPLSKPTLSSWAMEMESGTADLRPADFKESRPPTSEELAALRALADKIEGEQ